MLANWRHYNIEHLVEIAMCHVGGTTFVDQDQYDNSDYSETKTGSIRTHDGMATITGVVSDAGQAKCGDLRVIIHNQFNNTLHYYFLPKAYWETIREYGSSNRRVLRAQYNAATDTIYKWRRYRVASFHQLAVMPSTVSDPNHYAPLACPFNHLFNWDAAADAAVT